MTRRRKIVWSVIGALALAAAAVALYLRSFDWNRVKPKVAELTERYTGIPLLIEGKLDVDLGWRPRLRAERVTYGKLLDLRLFEGQLSLWSLLGGTLDFPQLRVEDGRILASAAALPGRVRREAARPKSGKKPWLPTVRVGRMTLRSLTVTAPRQGAEPLVLVVEDLRLDAMPHSERAVVYGDARLNGQALLVSGWLDGYSRLSDRTAHPFRAASKLGGGLTDISGSVRLPLRLTGDLLVDASGIEAVAAAVGLPLSGNVPELRLAAALDVAAQRLSAKQIDMRLGGSDVNGHVVVDLSGERPKLEAGFVAERLRFDDIGSLLPQKAARELPQARAKRKGEDRVLSPKPLPLSGLRKVDVDADVRVERFEWKGGLELVQGFRVGMRLASGELRIDPFRAELGDGLVDGTATMQLASDDAAKLELRGRLERLDIGRLAEAFLEKLEVGDVEIGGNKARQLFVGRLSGRLELDTRFSSLSDFAANLDGRIRMALEDGKLSSAVVEAAGLDVTETIASLFAKKQTVDLHCLVTDLQIDAGLVTPKVILVATEDSNIWVDGNVDLRKETLDVEIRTLPKDFSVGSLRGPIRLSGTFQNPRLDLGESAARLTAAVILGAVVNPAAALLALIEPAPGKPGQCARFRETIAALAH